MIGYVSVGADDLDLAEKFYSALLPALGYKLDISEQGLSYVLPVPQGQRPMSPDFYVKPPFNGQPASAGNGTMVALKRQPRPGPELMAAALAAGGHNEGAPGFRAPYSANFYVGYLRDPQRNKIALFCDQKDQPTRPD